MATDSDTMVPVASMDEPDREGRLVVSEGGQAIALFAHEGEVYQSETLDHDN